MHDTTAGDRRLADLDVFLLVMAGFFVGPTAILSSLALGYTHGWVVGLTAVLVFSAATWSMVRLAASGHRRVATMILVALILIAALMFIQQLSAF